MSTIGKDLEHWVRYFAQVRPDEVYQAPNDDTCVYVHDRQPSCLVGHALWSAGVIDASFEDRRGTVSPEWGSVRNNALLNEEGIREVIKALDLNLEPREIAWLKVVQSQQDDEAPWSVAVDMADKKVPVPS